MKTGLWTGRACLVTGAVGFIGTVLCERLRSAGAVVHAFGRGGSRESNGSFGVCDVSQMDQVTAAFDSVRPDCVFHLAGKVAGAQTIEMVRPTLAVDLVGTVNVLLAAAETKCSSVVCLASLNEPDQAVPVVPSSPYAAAKLGASAYSRMFAELFALPVTLARVFMVYGPGQLNFNKLIPYVSRQLISGDIAELSSGQMGFDWVYVDDVVEGLLAIAERPDLSGQTIDIGSGQITTVADVALGIGRRLNRADAVRLGVLPDRRMEPSRIADVDKAVNLIGWRPKIALDEGLDRTVAWYKSYFRRSGTAAST